MPRLPFLVDRIFPSREVHLICGPSGSGKTRFMFQLLTDWLAGRNVLDERSHPVPFYYVSCDRSLESVYRTLDTLSIPHNAFPILSTVTDPAFAGQPSMPGWSSVLKTVKERQPSTQAIFLDAFATLAGEAKYHDLHRFLAGVTRDCQHHDLTVWGSAHSPKMRTDSKISNPRQRVLGSVGWAGFCETIITVDPTSEEDALDPRRTIYVLPRNEPSQVLQYAFDTSGRLLPTEADTCAFFMLQELNKLPDEDLTTDIFVIIGTRFSFDRRTVERWLKSACNDLGLLTKISHGVYRKKPKN